MYGGGEKMKQYEMVEISLQGPEPEGNQVDINLKAVINGAETVRGFYAGNGQYKIRFYPEKAGMYEVKIDGIIQKTVKVAVEPAEPGRHGLVRTKGTAFCYEDGTAFHPFGTTVYALISQTDELIEQTMQTLEKAPFNKVRMCVFPKHYDFNHNEPSYYPFEKDENGAWDPSHPCFAFWDALDRHIKRLDSMGIQADLILFHPYDRWGFDGMGLERDKEYLDYALRRLSGWPNIWWSLANEYELCKRSIEDWYEIEQFTADHDPYHHLLSCHNIFTVWDASRPAVTHASIQSKNLYKLNDWRRKFGKPVMLDECCYEGNIEPFWGSITGKEMSRRFWRAVTTGAYCTHGETFYSDDDILWWARGGKLKGESPARIAFCRNIIESLPGHLEGEDSLFTSLLGLIGKTKEEQEAFLTRVPEDARHVVRAFLVCPDAREFPASETVWYGHIGNKVFLRFHDTRPLAQDTVKLPEGKKYRIDVIDTWNMTRETVARNVEKEYTVKLPGREDMAVLILEETAEQHERHRGD